MIRRSLHFNLCQIIGPENKYVLNNTNSHIIFHTIKDFKTLPYIYLCLWPCCSKAKCGMETDGPKHGGNKQDIR